MVYRAAAKYLCNVPDAESFCPRAASLLSFMFLNCKDETGEPPWCSIFLPSQHDLGGYVDGYVDDVANGLICTNFQKGSISANFKASLHRLSLHVLYYNPSIALQALEAKGNLKVSWKLSLMPYDGILF
eukprot:471400-Hanusia_phi.AAC.2